jgi:hypothetical protein
MTRKIIDGDGNETVPARAGDPKSTSIAAVTDMALALSGAIPDAVDDDGSGIIGRLLEADSWEDLNSEAGLPNGKDVAGRRLITQAIAKRQSDLVADEDSSGIKLPFYLVIDAVDERTGEAVRWQTSAPALVVPLMKLHLWAKLPALTEVRKADKPTKRGFYPLNMHVHAVG